MLKEIETEETIVFFVTFLSLVAFQLGGARAPKAPPSYAYDEVIALQLAKESTKIIASVNLTKNLQFLRLFSCSVIISAAAVLPQVTFRSEV